MKMVLENNFTRIQKRFKATSIKKKYQLSATKCEYQALEETLTPTKKKKFKPTRFRKNLHP